MPKVATTSESVGSHDRVGVPAPVYVSYGAIGGVRVERARRATESYDISHDWYRVRDVCEETRESEASKILEAAAGHRSPRTHV